MMAAQVDEEMVSTTKNNSGSKSSPTNDEAVSAIKKQKTENGEDSKTVGKETVNNGNQNEEEDEESLKDDLEDDEQQGGTTSSSNANVVKKPSAAAAASSSFLGHVCSVKTLIDDNVLIPEDNALSFEFMGKTFYADLLANGGIRWTENKQTFSTPSSWVNFCKRTVTSDTVNKSISAWSTIKYQGKRLDSYKLRWYRRQKRSGAPNSSANLLNQNQSNDIPLVHFDETNRTSDDLLKSIVSTRETLMSDIYFEDDVELNKKRNLVNHSDLPLKHLVGSSEPIKLSSNQLVKTESFSSIGRLQPFTITISTHALLLIDFHCHLTSTEVVGYLAGDWNASTLTLNISQAFPCRTKVDDEQKVKAIQDEVIQGIRKRNLSLIGWYHNHYNRAAQPTIKDIECQTNYQLVMCESEIQYLPCVGLICSPYDPHNKENCSSLTAFWTLPPPESRALEYPKPLHLFYQTFRDSFLTQDLLLEMRLLAHFYSDSEDKINFEEEYKNIKPNDENIVTYWDKLKYSIKPNLPNDLQVSNDLTPHQSNLQKTALQQFWTFLKDLLIKSPQSSANPATSEPATGGDQDANEADTVPETNTVADDSSLSTSSTNAPAPAPEQASTQAPPIEQLSLETNETENNSTSEAINSN